jgi:hypothetical protein
MNHPTMVVRKSALLACDGGYDPDVAFCEDYDLLIRVLKRFGAVYNMPDVVLAYRLHEKQITHNIQGYAEARRQRELALRRAGLQDES